MHESSPPLRYYLGVVRRQAWLIVLVTAASIGIAAVTTLKLDEPVHRASMKIVVGQGGGVFQPQNSPAVQPLTQTMTSLLRSDIVATTVITSLGLKMTPQHLLSTLKATSNPESSVLALSYDSTDEKQALAILDQVGSVFTSLIKQRLASSTRVVPGVPVTPPVTVTVFDPAHLEPGQVSPQPVRSIAIAGALGLAIGLILAFAREALDDRLRGRLDAERWFDAPVIGTLPKGALGSRPITVAISDSASTGDETDPPSAADLYAASPAKPRPLGREVVEAMSFLRANLEFSRGGTRGPILSVTSAGVGEGKAAVAAAIGVALAAGGYRVICVDADLRTVRGRSAPRGLDDIFLGRRRDYGRATRYGLSDILLEGYDVDETLVNLGLEVPTLPFRGADGYARSGNGREHSSDPSAPQLTQLRLLLPGQSPRRAAHMFTRVRVAWLLDRLRERADYVILDTSPLLGAGDAFPLLHASDNVIVVARAGSTRRANADAVRTTLAGLEIGNVSIVVTDADFRDTAGREEPPRIAEAIKTYFTT